MDRDDLNDELWESARLSIRGAYSPKTIDVPQVGDPKPLLRFLDHHISLSPEKRRNIGSWPVYFVFSALSAAYNEKNDPGLAGYDFTRTVFIDIVIEALGDKDSEPLRRSAIFILAKLDSHFFTANKSFEDEKRASRFVTAWSTAIQEFLGDPESLVGKAITKVLLAIAHLPCLRDHLPKERWDLIQHFPHIMVSNPPPLQRCLRDATIVAFFKDIFDPTEPSPWLLMLWVMHYHLSKDVRQKLEEETRGIAAGNYPYHLESYTDTFDQYIGKLSRKISALDPLDRASFALREKRQRMVDAKECLVRIQKKAKNNRGSGL